MRYKLTEKDVSDIEKVINKNGVTEAVVFVRDGELVILQQEKKKIN